MKKLIVLFTALAIGCGAWAKDFKIGEAKYEILTDNTVCLKDYRKASGDIVIPETVADPKSKKEYKVTELGRGAFNKSGITSVVIPKSIVDMDVQVFKDCTRLTKVTWDTDMKIVQSGLFSGCKNLESFDFNGIECVGPAAFMDAGFKAIEIPGSVTEIGQSAFLDCSNLTYVHFSAGPELTIEAGVFFGDPIETLFIDRDIVYKDADLGLMSQNKPFSNNPSLKGVWFGANANKLPKDVFKKCTGLQYYVFTDEYAYENALNVMKEVFDPYFVNYYIKKFTNDRNYNYNGNYEKQIPGGVFYVGTNTNEAGQISVDESNPLGIVDAIEKLAYNKRKDNFIKLIDEYIAVSINEPEHVKSVLRKGNEADANDFRDIALKAYNLICDSIYLLKPEWTKAEQDNIRGISYNYFRYISSDYVNERIDLPEWEKYDLINKEFESKAHKDILERIIDINKRLINENDFKENDYNKAYYNQGLYHTNILAALCALGRWEEASKLFPITHRLTTYKGEIDVYPEVTYLGKLIREHGYKAVVPKYGSKTKSSSSSMSSDDWIEFIVDRGVKAAVNRYEEKKDEKRRRQMLYEELGLDKNGRPKKHK